MMLLLSLHFCMEHTTVKLWSSFSQFEGLFSLQTIVMIKWLPTGTAKVTLQKYFFVHCISYFYTNISGRTNYTGQLWLEREWLIINSSAPDRYPGRQNCSRKVLPQKKISGTERNSVMWMQWKSIRGMLYFSLSLHSQDSVRFDAL